MRHRILGLALILTAQGCFYRGAIYSEYNHYGLRIRSSPEPNSPASVEMGYNHETVAFVPGKDEGNQKGEASSIIAGSVLGSDINPTHSGSNILSVRSVFISGTAAVIATIDPETTVELVGSDGTPDKAKIETRGDAAERLAYAFTPTARFSTAEDMAEQGVYDQIASLKNEAAANTIFENAKDALGTETDFTSEFTKLPANGRPMRTLFRIAATRFIRAGGDAPTRLARQVQITTVLANAVNDFKSQGDGKGK